MKAILPTLLLSAWSVSAGFTDFYIQSGGNNLNAGSTTNNSAPYSYSGGTFSTFPAVFTVGTGNPLTDGVTAGMWASIYTTAGAANAAYVALITDVTSTQILINTNAFGGSVGSVSASAAAATCTIGGAWAGPGSSGANAMFNWFGGTMTNSPSSPTFINIRGGTVYSTSAAIAQYSNGPVYISGYTTTPRDMGKATIDGGATGTGYNLFTVNGPLVVIEDLVLTNNGGNGATYGLELNAYGDTAERCAAFNMRGYGIIGTSASHSICDCEASGCDLSNTADYAGLYGMTVIGCWSHNNTTAQGCGFRMAANAFVMNCIASGNGRNGFDYYGTPANSGCYLINCVGYANKTNGFDFSAAQPGNVVMRNVAFLKNGLCGVGNTGNSSQKAGIIYNCTMGSGTYANGMADITNTCALIVTSGVSSYVANQTPWVDPDNGNFTESSAATTKAAGWGNLTQILVNVPTNTVSFPDIGATQTASTNNTSTVTNIAATSSAFMQ